MQKYAVYLTECKSQPLGVAKTWDWISHTGYSDYDGDGEEDSYNIQLLLINLLSIFNF